MKKITFLVTLFLIGYVSFSQVGIGTDTPETTLDVAADAANLTIADGIIAPRLSRAVLTAKSAAYGADQVGAMIYINDVTGATNASTVGITTVGYYYFDGTDWVTFTPSEEQSKWENNTTDNRVELASTTAGVGRGITNAFYIEDAGNVGIGVVDPDQKLSVGGNINTSGNLELNQLGTGDRTAIIDLHASDAASFSDFHTRIIRNSTENGNFSLTNQGTGDIVIDVLNVAVAGPSLSINGGNGFVGINRSLVGGPTQQLDVNGNGLFQNNLFVTGVPADGERGLRIHKDGGASAFFDINSDAATLVGTTTAFHWRGNNTNGTTSLMTLAYNGNLTNQGGLSTGGNLELFQEGTSNRASFIDFHSSATAGDNNARIIKNAGENGVLAINNSGTGDIRIDVQNAGQAGTSLAIDGDDGFVGVNRLNPSERLDVDGNGLFSGTLTSVGNLITSANLSAVDVAASGNMTAGGTIDATGNITTAANVETVEVLATGVVRTGNNIELNQLGTGNRTSLIDFHAAGPPSSNDFDARIVRNPGLNAAFNMTNTGTGNLNFDTTNSLGTSLTIRGSNGFVGINRTNPTQRLDVQGNGLFSGTVTSSAGLLTSDMRLKKDIVTIENSVETLLQLNPVYYSKKESIDSKEYNRKEYGFIAQELQKILPELVIQTTREDKVLAVDYNSIIPLLTKAIQEQQVQLDAKTNETEVLKSKVTALEAEITAIKKALKL